MEFHESAQRIGGIGIRSMAAVMIQLLVSVVLVFPKCTQVTMDTLDRVHTDPDEFLPSSVTRRFRV